MPTRPADTPVGLTLSLDIKAPPRLILRAFFDGDALRAWWQVSRSVTTPRPLGAYAIEWAPTDFRDDVLGRLGGVFRGTIIQFDPDLGFFVADAFWLPPDGDAIGPMALDVRCTLVELPSDGTRAGVQTATRVRVHQSGYEESERWRRYYEIVNLGYERALRSLKMLLEK